MRKSFLITLFALVLATADAQAQSLGDLWNSLFGSSSQDSAPVQVVIPSESDILGHWLYKSLDMEYSGSDMLASVAVAAAKSQLGSVAAKYGMVAGDSRNYVEIERKKLIIVKDKQKAEAKYTYNPTTGQMIITAEHDKQKYTLTAWITQRDGGVAVMFNAVELVAIASTTKQYQESQVLQTLGEMVKSYPEIRIGAVFTK